MWTGRRERLLGALLPLLIFLGVDRLVVFVRARLRFDHRGFALEERKKLIMSWSVSAVGKPAAVAASIESQFAASQCAEPEETVRQSARAAIAATLKAQREDSAVQVIASGSMSTSYNEETKTWGPPLTNQLEIAIRPLYGFVE